MADNCQDHFNLFSEQVNYLLQQPPHLEVETLLQVKSTVQTYFLRASEQQLGLNTLAFEETKPLLQLYVHMAVGVANEETGIRALVDQVAAAILSVNNV